MSTPARLTLREVGALPTCALGTVARAVLRDVQGGDTSKRALLERLIVVLEGRSTSGHTV
jgi:hypothetical protein